MQHINKELLKSRFAKSFNTYSENAEVQYGMAVKLINELFSIQQNTFNAVYEIGAGNGLLTEILLDKTSLDSLTINDLTSQSKEYINEICYKHKQEFYFIAGDAETVFPDDTFDLIISGSTFQWFINIFEFFQKTRQILNPKGKLAFSTFGKNNLKELQEIGLPHINYLSLEEIKDKLDKAGYKILSATQEEYTLYFSSPVAVLKHLKSTGVNAITKTKWTKGTLQDFNEQYIKRFSLHNKCSLTYDSIIIIAEKI